MRLTRSPVGGAPPVVVVVPPVAVLPPLAVEPPVALLPPVDLEPPVVLLPPVDLEPPLVPVFVPPVVPAFEPPVFPLLEPPVALTVPPVLVPVAPPVAVEPPMPPAVEPPVLVLLPPSALPTLPPVPLEVLLVLQPRTIKVEMNPAAPMTRMGRPPKVALSGSMGGLETPAQPRSGRSIFQSAPAKDALTSSAMSLSHNTRASRTLRALEQFLSGDLDEVLARHKAHDPAQRALKLFRSAAVEVPAYRRFLDERGVDVNAIVSAEAFARLPATSKADYHRAHALAELCRDGRLSDTDFVAVSSGSTGEPTFWPRADYDEYGTAYRFEQVLRDSFDLAARKTLGVVCFSLGSWVGGMYTTFACRALAAKGYPLTLVTPGNNRAEILRVVRALSPHFEQVVLFGYPPFLKDVIDAGRADGFAWHERRFGLVTAGEVFNETWRSLVSERLGARDVTRSIASLYGTADGGVLANETPVSTQIRRFLAERPEAARELFGEARLPTLCQYDPLHRYFEQDGDQLLFSGDGSVPLLRYRILDRGGVIPFSRMLAFVRDHGFEPGPEATAKPRELPFVFVFGRSGFALSFYGANVYPENVALGLEQPEVSAHVTGKFVTWSSRSWWSSVPDEAGVRSWTPSSRAPCEPSSNGRTASSCTTSPTSAAPPASARCRSASQSTFRSV
jgi:phenylacetate-CoA ligase